jgi:alpha-1,4-digalacturonate transport system substrate-binding protein
MKKQSLFTALSLAASVLITPVAHASQLKVLWYLGADAEEQSIKEALKTYTAKHPETSFDLQIVPYDGIEQKFAQFVASGDTPDITKTSSMRPVIRPYLVDLKQQFGPNYLKDFVPGWAMGAELGDQVIAAPLLVTATGILLNKSAFDKAGVAIPPADKGWTWDEFLKSIKTVQKKAGVRYPLVWDVSASRWIIHQFQYGNHIYSEKAPYKVVMDDAKWIAALDKFIDITKNYMPPGQWSGSSSDNPKQIFTSGQAVAWMSGSWQISGLAENAKFDWQAGPTPYGTVKSSIFGGDYVMAFNTGKHIKESTDFIKWLTSPEGQAVFCKAPMYIPANLNTGKLDLGNERASAALVAMQKELADSPEYGATDQGNEAMQYVWDTIKQSVVQAVTGQLTSAQAIAAIHKAADESLAASK